VPDNSDEPSSPRRRPPYAGNFSGGGPREDRWRTWEATPDMDDDEEESAWQRLGHSRGGPIVIGLTLLLAAGTGIWFAWPEDDRPPAPAAVQSPARLPSASPSEPALGVDSPPPPPEAPPTPRTRRGASPGAESPRTVVPPPPPAASKSPQPTKRPKARRSPEGQSGPTAPPPPPTSSRPTSEPTTRPTTAPPDDDGPQTGPTLPPPPPGG
jgi:hypothetical protein